MNLYRMPMFFLCVLLVSACSGTTFVYNRLHVVVPLYMNGYVDLDRDQGDQLRAAMQTYFDRHRVEYLPRYAVLLGDTLAMLDGPVTPGELEALYNRSQREMEILQSDVLDWLLPIGESLSDEQLGEFIDNLAEKQREYEEKYLERSDARYREEAYRSLRKNLSRYLGALNREQKDILRAAAEDLERSDSLWLAEREAWTSQLAVALEREPGWQRQVRHLVDSRLAMASDDYRAAFNHNLDVMLDAVAAVIDSRSDRQDRVLRREIAGFQRDFCRLVAQGYDNREDSPPPLPACEAATLAAGG